MRKSLPHFTERGLGYSIKHDTVQEQIAEQEPQQPVSNAPALHTAYINLMGWNCSFHGSLRLLRYDRFEAALPSRSLRSKRRLVGATGIEPVTPTMSRKCSPAELRALDRMTKSSRSSFSPYWVGSVYRLQSARARLLRTIF